MLVRRLIQVVPLAFILLAACGQSKRGANDNGLTSGSDQKGYLHADSDSVIFLRWTEINGKLNGQMNVFFAKGNRTRNTDTSAHSFEGVSDGKNLSLNFTGSVWTDGLGGKTWTGTISGNELTLVIPSNNGQLSPVRFIAGTVEEFNDAVLLIKKGVREQNATVQQENADAARVQSEQTAVFEANNRVRSSLEMLNTATTQLAHSLNFDPVFEAYEKTWEKMKSDHANLIAKANERPLTSYKVGEAQYLLSTLKYDIGTFEYHSGTLVYNFKSVTDAIKSVRDAQSKVRINLQELQRAAASNSSGTPAAEFSEADVLPPIKAGDEKIQEAIAAVKKASVRRGQYQTQAKELYRKDEVLVKGLKATD